MKRPVSKPEIKESLSGAFFVKAGPANIGGFQKREHAELFLKAFESKDAQDLLWTEVYGEITKRSPDEIGLREAFKAIESKYQIGRKA